MPGNANSPRRDDGCWCSASPLAARPARTSNGSADVSSWGPSPSRTGWGSQFPLVRIPTVGGWKVHGRGQAGVRQRMGLPTSTVPSTTLVSPTARCSGTSGRNSGGLLGACQAWFAAQGASWAVLTDNGPRTAAPTLPPLLRRRRPSPVHPAPSAPGERQGRVLRASADSGARPRATSPPMPLRSRRTASRQPRQLPPAPDN